MSMTLPPRRRRKGAGTPRLGKAEQRRRLLGVAKQLFGSLGYRRATLDVLGALPVAVYRAKGVVRYAGASVPALVNVTAGRLQSQWEPGLSGAAGSALVFIGRDAPAWRDGLLAALAACVAPTA